MAIMLVVFTLEQALLVEEGQRLVNNSSIGVLFYDLFSCLWLKTVCLF